MFICVVFIFANQQYCRWMEEHTEIEILGVITSALESYATKIKVRVAHLYLKKSLVFNF